MTSFSAEPFRLSLKDRLQLKKSKGVQCYRRIMMALRTGDDVTAFVFHLGYQQFDFPRWLRRLYARTELHRAWLSGRNGYWLKREEYE